MYKMHYWQRQCHDAEQCWVVFAGSVHFAELRFQHYVMWIVSWSVRGERKFGLIIANFR